MGSTSQLVWAVIFGGIGLGFFTYGRKQRAPVPLLAGIALFAIPYLITNVYVLVLTGSIVIALPYFVSL